MFLDAEISSTEALDVGFIEGLELQGLAPCLAEVPASLAPCPRKIGSERLEVRKMRWSDLALSQFSVSNFAP
jgi:hypothetical protein